jgi:hypothetical protein
MRINPWTVGICPRNIVIHMSLVPEDLGKAKSYGWAKLLPHYCHWLGVNSHVWTTPKWICTWRINWDDIFDPKKILGKPQKSQLKLGCFPYVFPRASKMAALARDLVWSPPAAAPWAQGIDLRSLMATILIVSQCLMNKEWLWLLMVSNG